MQNSFAMILFIKVTMNFSFPEIDQELDAIPTSKWRYRFHHTPLWIIALGGILFFKPTFLGEIIILQIFLISFMVVAKIKEIQTTRHSLTVIQKTQVYREIGIPILYISLIFIELLLCGKI